MQYGNMYYMGGMPGWGGYGYGPVMPRAGMYPQPPMYGPTMYGYGMPGPMDMWGQPTPQMQFDMLAQQAELLGAELDEIKRQLAELQRQWQAGQTPP